MAHSTKRYRFKITTVIQLFSLIVFATLSVSGAKAETPFPFITLDENLNTDLDTNLGKKLAVGGSIGIPQLTAFSVRYAYSSNITTAFLYSTYGAQAQINFTAGNPYGPYRLIALSHFSPDTVTLLKGGVGYRWQYEELSFYAEMSANLPINDPNDSVDDSFGIVYFLPLSVGVHFNIW